MGSVGVFYGNTVGQKLKFRVACELQWTEQSEQNGYKFQKRYWIDVSIGTTTTDTSISYSWGSAPVKVRNVGQYAISPWMDIGTFATGSTVTVKDVNAKYVTGGTTYESKLNVSYTVAKDTYTVDYSANGGVNSPSSQTFKKDGQITISSTVPTRTGYGFKYWNTSPDGTGVSYMPGSVYKMNSSVTLYAIWEIKTVTVSFYKNDGSDIKKEVVFTYGKTTQRFSSNDWTNGKYALIGYAEKADATESKYSVNYLVTDSWINSQPSKVELYAVWSNRIGSTQNIFVKNQNLYKNATMFIRIGGIYKDIVKAYVKDAIYK